MANVSGNAYALTIFSPIRSGHIEGTAYADEIRHRLQQWHLHEKSPMAKTPNTYLCRYFILDDIYYQSLAGCQICSTIRNFLAPFIRKVRLANLPKEDHLKSKYLIFSTNFHGDLDTYLKGMWDAISDDIQPIWEYCYGFDQVTDRDSFVDYMKKCQIDVSLFFVGSNDDSLQEQLKGLYLKQEFSRFAVEHQGLPAAELQKAFEAFIQRVDPTNLTGPSWAPGQSTL